MTLREMTVKVLTSEGKALSAKEIWTIAEQKGLLKKLNMSGKTPYSTFTAMLHNDKKRPKPSFIENGARPIKFSLRK